MGSGFSSLWPGWKSWTSTVSSASMTRSRSGTSSGPPLMFFTFDMRVCSRYLDGMADVKTPELSPDEWRELLGPYGWADITTRSPAVRFKIPAPILEWDIRLMLKPG